MITLLQECAEALSSVAQEEASRWPTSRPWDATESAVAELLCALTGDHILGNEVEVRFKGQHSQQQSDPIYACSSIIELMVPTTIYIGQHCCFYTSVCTAHIMKQA